MERRPEFEDEKLRIWRLAEGVSRPERDPTVLDVDTATEEPYESRVYAVRPEAVIAVALQAIAERGDVAPRSLAAALGDALEDASLRILAKRTTTDSRISFVLVGLFAGRRALLAREDSVDETRFQAFVRGFEEQSLDLLMPPTVIGPDEWRRYQSPLRR